MRPKVSCGVFDCISAYYASQFCDFFFFSGLSISTSQYLEEDSGLHSIDRLLRLSSQVTSAGLTKPIIADIDDSFGDYSLAGKYGKRLTQSGFYGVVIEDQARPRKCGHKTGKMLAPSHLYRDGIMRLRDECPDIYIVGRTDAESPEDLKERLDLLAELGSDKIINAVQVDGIATLSQIAEAKQRLPEQIEFVANHVDGGKLINCSMSSLSASGVDILTLSTYLLGRYLNALRDASDDFLNGDVLPDGRISLSTLDKLLSST